MAIAHDATGTPVKQTASATSATVNITSAAVGAWCYFGGGLSASQGGVNVTFTGWTQVLEGDESTATHFFLWKRQKQAGDTTFTVSWPTSARLAGNWESYTGLSSSPDELAAFLAHTASVSFPTSSLTPNGTGRWSFTFTYTRDTTAASDLPDGTTWTPDAALTERTDASNGAAVTSPWMSIETADSNGTVTQAAQSYTATCNFSETHGGAILLFLVPSAAAGPAGTVQPAATVPVPRRRPARALWQRITGQAFVKVPAPAQQPRPAPRRVPARAIWRSITGQAFVQVPAPRQQPAPAPRRRPARAYIRFTPVTTTNAAAVTPPAGTVQSRATLVTTRRRLSRAVTPVPLIPFAPVVPAVTEGGAVYYPYHHRGRGRTR